MLYAKIDNAGNPVEVAKNYLQIKGEFLKQNAIIPNESVFFNNPALLGYAHVPVSEPPKPKAGMKVVPDIPTKNSDGTYQRTWKEVAVNDMEKKEMDLVMRSRRKEVLRNNIDTISPVRWNNMSEEDKAEVNAFYKEVLDMPEDPSWPFITFPIRPNCLR